MPTGRGLAILLGALVSGCAQPAEHPVDRDVVWARAERLSPAASNGPFTAYLDRGPVLPPDPDTAPTLRGLAGRWQGWVGRDRSASIAIEIDHIDARSASGRYAHAAIQNVNGNLGANRVFPLECTIPDQTYLDCGLSRSGPAAYKVYLKPRSDGALMFLYTRNDGQNYALGLLTREDGPRT